MSKPLSYQQLANYQLIRVSGPDSHKFLQGQLTCDIDDANGEKAVIGGYCNVQGRLHASFYLLKVENDYLLLLPKEVAQHLLETLAKYAVFFQTELGLDDELTAVAYQHQLDSPHLSQNEHMGSQQFVLGSLAIILLPQEQLAQSLEDNFAQYQVANSDLLAIEQIELSIPMIQESTIEKFLPHYIGLTQVNGVNFEKGCYTGQEVVARMHYRGTLKTHPHKAVIESEQLIEAGTEIFDENDKKVGELVNCTKLENGLTALISLADKAQETSLKVAGKELKLL